MSGDNLDQLSPSQDDDISRLATFVIDRQLETPALVALEILSPFGFLVSQFLVMAEPLLGETQRLDVIKYQHLLQDRAKMKWLKALLAHEASVVARSVEDPCQPSPS